MEYLDVVDEFGEPTGEITERSEAHRKGIRHRTSHVWIYSLEKDKPFILVQKRCSHKDSYPNCYDISSAGHIPAGIGYEESAIRELKEELGLEIDINQLQYIGQNAIYSEEEFYGEKFTDNQIYNVYMLQLPVNTVFTLQESEIDDVKWFEFDDLCNAVKNNNIKHCIIYDELMMISGFFGGEVNEK
ncbi:MAG: NUDIX domain-containing protein [Clostridia bacterium]|nr:NUDIX domain-containing protein [Clostridia bacterium]